MFKNGTNANSVPNCNEKWTIVVNEVTMFKLKCGKLYVLFYLDRKILERYILANLVPLKENKWG